MILDHEEANELLGAWALHACDEDEGALVEAHVATCDDCAAEADRLRNAAAWLGALESVPPPSRLRASVLRRARDLRAPEMRRATPAPATPATLMAESVDRLDTLLRHLAPADWAAVTLTGFTVQDFVAHLTAAASLINWRLGLLAEDPGRGITDWEPRTDVFLGRHRGLPPAATLAAWREQVAVLQSFVTGAGVLDQSIEWQGWDTPLQDVVTIHGFETWLHTDDIRRAVDRPIAAPSPPHLAIMCELATNLLSVAMRAHGVNRRTRLVLTGPGGGDWLIPLGGSEIGPPDAIVTADAVAFCTLVGGRLTPDVLPHRVEGDAGLARALLDTATSFAVV
jgi:uncharacterized protein (TIGR03083 family)